MSEKAADGHGGKAVYAALAANLGIALAKFAGFMITGATALLAEAAHSVADTGNQGLLLLGMRRSRRSHDQEHPFGYGQERYFWAFVVAMVLFSLGALFSLYEGIEKLRHPHPIDSPIVAIVILLVAMALEGYSLRTAAGEARPHKGEMTWWQFIRHSRSAELPVVLLEDVAALIGLAVALIGISLSALTHTGIYDSLATLAISGLLAVIACVLAIEMKSLLIGEPATLADEAAIRDAIRSVDAVKRLIHIRTLQLGPDDVLVAAKIELDGSPDFDEVAATIDEAEARIRSAVPSAKVIYLEPDRYMAEKDEAEQRD